MADFQLHEDWRCVGGETADGDPDGPMNADQQARADALSLQQIQAIDRTILKEAGPDWRKVARVVARAMMTEEPKWPSGIADIYFGQRVASLVERGSLEAKGDLGRMRVCEVRLPAPRAPA